MQQLASAVASVHAWQTTGCHAMGHDSLSFAKRELTPRQKRAAAEFNIQQFVMDGQRQKARIGEGYINELHTHAVELFAEGADTMWALRAGKRDPLPQQLLDQFTVRQIQRNGIYL